MSRTTVYVEGGGSGRELRAKCRKGFLAFFGKSDLAGRLPKVVASGPRGSAFDKFRVARRRANSDELPMLLVDSEGPVPERRGTWSHLKTCDNWDKPRGASDDDAHLMVQCMEAWFLADKEALASYFGSGYSANAIPANPNIEEVPKRDIENGLRNATRNCSKGSYDKGRDSFAILGDLDPQKVEDSSPHAARLLEALRSRATP